MDTRLNMGAHITDDTTRSSSMVGTSWSAPFAVDGFERSGRHVLAEAESEKLTLLHAAVSRLESIITTLSTPLTAMQTADSTPVDPLSARRAEPIGTLRPDRPAEQPFSEATHERILIGSDSSTAVRPQPRQPIPSPVLSPGYLHSSVSSPSSSVLDSPTSAQRSTLSEAHTLSAMAPRHIGAHTSPQCVGCAPAQEVAAMKVSIAPQSVGKMGSRGARIHTPAEVGDGTSLPPPDARWPLSSVRTAEESHRALQAALTDPISGGAFGLYTNMQSHMLTAAAHASEAAAAFPQPHVGPSARSAATPLAAAAAAEAKVPVWASGAAAGSEANADRPRHVITEELPARGYDGLRLRAATRESRMHSVDAECTNPTGWACTVPGCPCSSIVRDDLATMLVCPLAQFLCMACLCRA